MNPTISSKQMAQQVLLHLEDTLKNNNFTDGQIAYIELALLELLKERFDR